VLGKPLPLALLLLQLSHLVSEVAHESLRVDPGGRVNGERRGNKKADSARNRSR
jgi:hypothetical protein